MLNIVTHPHSPEDYVKLLERGLHVDVPMGGDRRARIGTLSAIGADPLDGIQGNIYRYTKIDMNSPWLNTESGKEVDPLNIHELVDIPDNLRPNLSTIWYNFYPRSHRLVFETERNDPHTGKPVSFSPSTAQLFFQKVFNTLKTDFDTIRVTVVQDHETLETIFSLPYLRKLEIKIERPNPTDGRFAQMMARQLEKENVHDFEQIMVSKSADGLKPTKRTKGVAKVATTDGYVYAEGNDEEGEKVTLKTTLKPVEARRYFDGNEGFLAAFFKAASSLLQTYKAK